MSGSEITGRLLWVNTGYFAVVIQVFAVQATDGENAGALEAMVTLTIKVWPVLAAQAGQVSYRSARYWQPGTAIPCVVTTQAPYL